MRVAVVFDTPYSGWDHADHERQMALEIAAWKADEPEMEYQIAHALRERGHDVRLLGVRDDLQYLIRYLREWSPDLVFNGAEAYRGDETLEYLLPALLEAEGYRYTGAPPLALQMTRNKAISKKVLAYYGIQVPGFVSYRTHEEVEREPDLAFPLIVKPLQTDGSAGIAQASVVQDAASLAERVTFIQERFGQGAIAEEFVVGRELYVSIVGNDDDLEILPITEMVFDKRNTRPEERIATQFAKWDEEYRERKGIRNGDGATHCQVGARPNRGDLPHGFSRALAPRLCQAGSATRSGRRDLGARGERQPLYQLRARHGQCGRQSRHGVQRVHRADCRRGDSAI